MLQLQHYPICCVLVDWFIRTRSDYFPYLIIHHFKYVVSNVITAFQKIQYANLRCFLFTANTHLHGGKTYLTIQLISWQVIMCPTLWWSLWRYNIDMWGYASITVVLHFVYSTFMPVAITYCCSYICVCYMGSGMVNMSELWGHGFPILSQGMVHP